MNYRILFVINALVAIAFGLAFLFVPTMALLRFGVDEYASTRLVVQFFGTALLTVGLLAWFAQKVSEPGIQTGLCIALLVGSVAGLVMSIIGTVTGLIRSLGWLAIVVYVLFVLGYGFLLFLKPKMVQ